MGVWMFDVLEGDSWTAQNLRTALEEVLGGDWSRVGIDWELGQPGRTVVSLLLPHSAQL